MNISENQYYREMEGDLIQLAKEGRFDVIAHGCNCFCTMKKGIALAMAENFDCNMFPLEDVKYKGDINKLGQIDWRRCIFNLSNSKLHGIYVVNCYTQYSYQRHPVIPDPKPFDYDAFRLCMRKMNYQFNGKHIGLPMIGSGLAAGRWESIKLIIQQELKDCNVTVVIHKP